MSRIKFGIAIGSPGPSPERIIQRAVSAEESGFDSFWIADHIVSYSETCVDAWPMLSAVAMVTKNIQLATGVTDPYRRHPLLAAQSVATIDQISKGRFLVGIGPGEPMNLEPMGEKASRSVARMIEYVKVMRRLLAGETVNHKEPFFTLNKALLQVKPVQKTVPFYIAANGPMTRKIAGEIGNGWYPTMESPEIYAKHLKDVEAGCRSAQRNLEDVDTALFMYTAVSEKSDLAVAEVNKYKTVLASFPGKLTEAYGVKIDESFSWADKAIETGITSKWSDIASQIPDRALTEFNIVGNPDECIAQLEAFIKAGVKHFSLLNVGPSVRDAYRLYAEKIIPYFREQYKD